MASLVQKLFYAGVGLVATTSEKVQAQIDELVEKGKLSREEGKEIVEEFVDKAEEKKGMFEGKIKDMVSSVIDTFNLPTADDLKDLMDRIEKLEAQGESKVEETVKKVAATTKRRAKTTAKKVTTKAETVAKK